MTFNSSNLPYPAKVADAGLMVALRNRRFGEDCLQTIALLAWVSARAKTEANDVFNAVKAVRS